MLTYVLPLAILAAAMVPLGASLVVLRYSETTTTSWLLNGIALIFVFAATLLAGFPILAELTAGVAAWNFYRWWKSRGSRGPKAPRYAWRPFKAVRRTAPVAAMVP